MSRRLAVFFLALYLLPFASAQTAAPRTLRIVTPKGPGSITVNMDGWTLERLVLYDHGTRAVLQLKSDALGIVVSYILSNDETFDFNKESCKNDVLGPVVRDALKKATLRNKQNVTRTLPTGQILDIGSYLILKDEGVELNQQNVFGFISHDHTCAEIHLSRTPFKEGEEHLFDSALDNFHFDPGYVPTPSDYQAMASLLPPGMASAYGTKLALEPSGERTDAGQSLSFALPARRGFAHMDAPNFIISELSAKPSGSEFGIRARDHDISGAEVLGFLFVPEPPQPTAVACRDWMLHAEKAGGVTNRKVVKTYEGASDSGVPVALVEYEQTKAPPSSHFVRRFFAAGGGLCLDVSVTAANELMTSSAQDLYKTLVFDINQPPDFAAVFRYATVVFDHHNPAAAAPFYEKALTLADRTDDPTRWRRVATDQASMAYGMAGDLTRSRAINEAAIARDPDYPLFYYNLACADAEVGDAIAARKHLQQAFDHRANTLKGETLPDPAKDDSILKLKSDKAFWGFVESLPKG